MKIFLCFALIFILKLELVKSQSNITDEFCTTLECLLDSKRLLESSNLDSVSPCDNFLEFSVGKFLKLRPLHDRYGRVGFLFDVLAKQTERFRKILGEPIQSKDIKAFKIAKKFASLCFNPDNVRGVDQEMSEYLRSLYSFPLYEGANWHPDQVNMSVYFYDNAFRPDFLLTHTITKCPHPKNAKKYVICLKYNHSYGFFIKLINLYSEKVKQDFYYMLREINETLTVGDAIVNASIDHWLMFFEQKSILHYPGRQPKPVLLKLKEINSVLFPHSKAKIDWMLTFNNFFLNQSKASKDDELVLIEDSEVFAGSVNILESLSNRITTDAMMLGFLYGFKHMIIIYPNNRIDFYKRGTAKEYQRFEQCINHLETFFSPALHGLAAKKFYKRRDQKFAEAFIQEALNDVIDEIEKISDLSEDVKNDISELLNTVEIVAGYPREIISQKKINEIYDELNLNTENNLLEMAIEMVKYNYKLDNERNSNWISRTNKLTQLNNLKYLTDENILYIPMEYIVFPYFNNQKSRFFNTATLFTEVVLSVNDGLKGYLKNKYNFTYSFDYDSISMGYKNYIRWEENNKNNDKKLPGFNLTNRQMYWLSFANTYYMKFHREVPLFQLESLELQFKYYHVWFKARQEFREAFNCSDMTKVEKLQFDEFAAKIEKVFRS